MDSELTPGKTDPKPGPRSASAPIIARAPLPIVEVQGSAHLVSFVNPAFCRLVGKTSEELSGMPFDKIVPGGDECIPILDGVYHTGKAAAHAREDDSQGDPAYWLYAMWPALDAHERPVGVIIQLTRAENFRHNATAINEALLIAGLRQHELTEAAEKLNTQLQAEIIERNNSEAALRVSERETKRARDYAEATLRTTPIPLLVLEDDLRVKTCNEAFYKNFKVNPAQTEGRFVYEIGNGQWNIPRLHELLEDILPHRSWFEGFEVIHEFESIGRRTMLLNARRMENEAGQPSRVVLVIEDITERKAVDEALRRALEREKLARDDADTANRSKDLFLATLSHEMRTPLNAVMGWVSLLRRGAFNPDEVREGLEVIERSTRAQAQLIEDVLDVSRIIAGKLQLDIRPADLVSIINAAVDLVRQAAQASEVRLKMELDPSAAQVPCDPARMQQVLLNLLSNSIKFSRKGGFVRVTLSRDGAGSRARITVEDDGRGINLDFLPRVFDRFRQEGSGTTRNYSGLGLGLSIVKTLVELHGGSVEARSEGEGRGATFIISLPIEPVIVFQSPQDPVAAGAATVFADPSSINLDGVRILIVDDQPDARDLLARVLEGFGARASTAGSVAEALAVLPSIRPQVLISDIAMPIENGFDLIRQVRALGYSATDLPAVALTAYVQPEDRLNATMAGFQVHVPKPVDPYNLIAVIARLAAGADVTSPA
ncbi:MAG TPA: ATP-binding protein [Tepidisphaeraceae bacterium]|nr:ATP-binding protein [Tepidisphaeraceae bacterium]